VGAPQRSGEGVLDASEEARLVSNSVLRSFMVVTSLSREASRASFRDPGSDSLWTAKKRIE
jgi:hypothetical protein